MKIEKVGAGDAQFRAAGQLICAAVELFAAEDRGGADPEKPAPAGPGWAAVAGGLT